MWFFFLETKSHYVALADLEFTGRPGWLPANRPTFLCLQSNGIKGVCHHTWPRVAFIPFLLPSIFSLPSLPFPPPSPPFILSKNGSQHRPLANLLLVIIFRQAWNSHESSCLSLLNQKCFLMYYSLNLLCGGGLETISYITQMGPII